MEPFLEAEGRLQFSNEHWSHCNFSFEEQKNVFLEVEVFPQLESRLCAYPENFESPPLNSLI